MIKVLEVVAIGTDGPGDIPSTGCIVGSHERKNRAMIPMKILFFVVGDFPFERQERICMRLYDVFSIVLEYR